MTKDDLKAESEASVVKRIVMPDHQVIYLIPDGNGSASWCDDPAPGAGMEESDAIKYIREDCIFRPAPCKRSCEATAFKIELRQLRKKVQNLEEEIDRKNERLIHIKNAVNKSFKV